MKRYFFILLVAVAFIISCTKQKRITAPADYNAFLKKGIIKQEAEKVNAELSFWQQRLQKDTGNFVDMLKMASRHLHLFRMTGNVADLKLGDSLLKRSDSKLKNTDPDILHALSQNSITQHRFHDADLYNTTAVKAGSDLYTTCLLEFDAGMELGTYRDASQKLEQLVDKSSFDYLIRKAKLEDHRGNLDKAIILMEQAFEKIKNRNQSLYCWTLSNLADMYGHAGKIDQAYKAYLTVLQKDNSFLYALKGIAWIAYSHDKNSKEAKRILHYLLLQTKMPDLYLMLAELEEFDGNENKKMEYLLQFLADVERPEYGDMYNKYLIHIYTEEIKDYDKALALAEKEINNRPTPETHSWLAWVYYNKGDNSKAFTIAKNYVNKQNFEPDAVLNTALIYTANGKKAEARKMLKECLSASFEIGPVKTKFVQEQLDKL